MDGDADITKTQCRSRSDASSGSGMTITRPKSSESPAGPQGNYLVAAARASRMTASLAGVPFSSSNDP